jgi:hypothetical protein
MWRRLGALVRVVLRLICGLEALKDIATLQARRLLPMLAQSIAIVQETQMRLRQHFPHE